MTICYLLKVIQRRIVDFGYLTCLHRPNVSLVDSPIVTITPTGLQTADGKEHQADVIIYATGFQTGIPLHPLQIYGRGGESLHEHWDRLGGASAYNSIANHGFPNFFALLGPNSITGHTSALMAAEKYPSPTPQNFQLLLTLRYSQAAYALKVLYPVLVGKVNSVEVTETAEKNYVSQVQNDIKKTVFGFGCKAVHPPSIHTLAGLKTILILSILFPFSLSAVVRE
jgi:hypothetical protein